MCLNRLTRQNRSYRTSFSSSVTPKNSLLSERSCQKVDYCLVFKITCSWCDGSSDRSFMVDPFSYFSFQSVLHDGCICVWVYFVFQPVLHDWCNKGCLLMVRWVVGSILHGGPIQLFLVPVGAPRRVYQRLWDVLSCLWDGVYKRTLVVNRKE